MPERKIGDLASSHNQWDSIGGGRRWPTPNEIIRYFGGLVSDNGKFIARAARIDYFNIQLSLSIYGIWRRQKSRRISEVLKKRYARKIIAIYWILEPNCRRVNISRRLS